MLQCPDFNSLSVISFIAAVMSLLYSSIGIGGSIANGQAADVQYNLDGLSKPAGIFGAFNALGVIAFAYGGTHSSSPPSPALQRPVNVLIHPLTTSRTSVTLPGLHLMSCSFATYHTYPCDVLLGLTATG